MLRIVVRGLLLSVAAFGSIAAQPAAQNQPPRELSAAEARALGGQQLGSVSGNYMVKPTEVYAKIDVSASNAILDQLNSADASTLSKIIATVEASSGSYTPPVLMRIAISEYERHEMNKAIFWFQAGLIRSLVDAQLCTDPSAGSAPTDLIHRSPEELVRAAFSTDPKVVTLVSKVVAWDEITPVTYDRRWIALHGSGATLSALDPSSTPTELIRPREQWSTADAQVRASYPGLVASNAVRISSAKH